MKISEDEVTAACRAYDAAYMPPKTSYMTGMRAALNAAYAVRKARKAAKRARKADETDALDRSINLMEKNWRENPENATPTAVETKPEQPERQFKVGDRVAHAILGPGSVVSIDESYLPYRVDFGDDMMGRFGAARLSPEPAKPEWNGKFEVGKAYRTRDGRKVIISDVINPHSYPLRGELSGYFDSWTVTGLNLADDQNSGDLIGPWEESV